MQLQRMTFLRVVLLSMIAVLVGRLYHLQFLDRDTLKYGAAVQVNTTRYIPVQPRRGEVLASDGKTLLAESVPTYHVAVLPGSLPPQNTEQHDEVIGKLSRLCQLVSTLTLTPSDALAMTPNLYDDLSHIVGTEVLSRSYAMKANTPSALTFTIAPTNTLDAIRVFRTYDEVLTFENPIETQISRSTTRHYVPVVVKENVSEEMALAIQENARYLPGAIVVETYQRRYPMSDKIPSLSHILGYIGRISDCELVTENPVGSWLDGLVDTIGHVANCGVRQKQVNPSLIGIPPYQNNDHIGKDGLEASYEPELRGHIGIDTILVDALERPVSGKRTMQPVDNGENLILTIDTAFQRQTEILLKRWIAEGETRRLAAEDEYKKRYSPITNGVAVVMDPRDGRIFAMVSLPSYDNNVWVDPERSDELQQLLHPESEFLQKELARLSPLTNRAIAGQYPPGSTLKQFVGPTALQKGIINSHTRLRDPGKLVLKERSGVIFTLPNSVPTDNGEINVSDALKVSSNVFFAAIAGGNNEAINLDPGDAQINGLGIENLSEGLEWFGFGQSTKIKLPGEAAGRVPNPIWKAHMLREPWTTGDTYNTAIGQGYLEVTPLQLINAAAAVANGGTVYRPRLIQTITDSSGTIIRQEQPEVLGKIPVESSYLHVVREGMRRSVTEGLNVAAREDCSGVRIAGKTGTAEFGPLIIKPNGEIARRSHAWFVGFAPYENPEVIVVVLLEGTGDLGDGSSTLAVPAVTQIIQSYFHVDPPTNPSADCLRLPL